MSVKKKVRLFWPRCVWGGGSTHTHIDIHIHIHIHIDIFYYIRQAKERNGLTSQVKGGVPHGLISSVVMNTTTGMVFEVCLYVCLCVCPYVCPYVCPCVCPYEPYVKNNFICKK
jgi:hypothetical protein